MEPNEFWNCSYREINVFTQSRLCRIMDEFRQQIELQEAVTDKLIQADAMSNKKPRIISLLKIFEKTFPKREESIQSAQEISEKMRKIMKKIY